MSSVGSRVRVTTAPWAGELGTIENIDGAYHLVRFDSSKHPDDVKELYPNEFETLDVSCACAVCTAEVPPDTGLCKACDEHGCKEERHDD